MQTEIETALRELLEASDRVAIYRFADGSLSTPGKKFYAAKNKARLALGLPIIESNGRATILIHSGINESDS